jgi:hypothetical protein
MSGLPGVADPRHQPPCPSAFEHPDGPTLTCWAARDHRERHCGFDDVLGVIQWDDQPELPLNLTTDPSLQGGSR